jgi:hypothetical protein
VTLQPRGILLAGATQAGQRFAGRRVRIPEPFSKGGTGERAVSSRCVACQFGAGRPGPPPPATAVGAIFSNRPETMRVRCYDEPSTMEVTR